MLKEKNQPACFACSKGTKVLAFFYVVPWTSIVLGVDPLHTNHGSMASLVDILEEVLSSKCRATHFTVDMCLISQGGEGVVCYYPSVVHDMAFVSDTTFTMIRRATTVGRIDLIWLSLCVA